MNKKKFILFIGVFLSVVVFIFTFIYYKSNHRLTIYASDDSYAYRYAKENMINTFNLSDSHDKYFHRIWEEFKVNIEKDGLVITKYEGISEELIIPTLYNGKKIVKIEKGALPTNVKKIFLPDSVKTIDVDDFSDIEILCYRGSRCNELKENEKLQVNVLDDVDRYILKEQDLEFTYNIIHQNEIELTNYLGNDEIVAIPETINGYKVTSMTFDGAGITAMFIPKTVNSISGNITSKLLNKSFIISSIIILISFIVYYIAVLFSKIHESIDKVYVCSTSMIYLIVVYYFIYAIRRNPFENMNYLIYSAIASVLYLMVIYLLNHIIKNNKKFDEDIKKKGIFIKEVNLLLQDYDFKELNEISNLIKYSDPVSIDEVKEIEQNIKDEIHSINDSNIEEKTKKLKKLIQKRNTIIKDQK